MTDIPITANERKAQFTGNTGLGPFAFTFNILASSDIRVIKNSTVLTLTSEYTISTNVDGTGSVTLTGSGNGTALIASDVLTIIGNRQLARTSDYVQGGNLFAEALNEDLDSVVIMMQQLDEKVSRTMRVDAGDVAGALLIPEKNTRANKYLAFGVDGEPVATSGTSSSFVVSAFAETFLDDDTPAEFLATLGITSTVAELNILDGVTASAAELNILDGVTASAAEINLLDGKTLSGSDAEIITGTAGTNGHIVQWNADGDLVSYGAATQLQATWEAGTGTTESLVSPAKVKAAIDALQYKPFAEAYVTYSGTTPTMVAEYGMDTVSRPGTGDTAFVFDTAQPDTNYTIESHMQFVGNVSDARYHYWILLKSTTGFTVRWRSTTLGAFDIDISVVCKRLA